MDGTQLNENQMSAVNHFQGPMMVLAGPGSGKTMVITHRTKKLIEEHGVSPNKIAVITFTKAAGDEMKSRFHSLLQRDERKRFPTFFGTFHSFYFKILRRSFGYSLDQLLMEEEKRSLFKQIILSNQISYEDEQEFIENLESEISYMKNEMIQLTHYHSRNFSGDVFHKIFKTYEAYKRKKRKIDFDDMLLFCYTGLSRNETVLSYWQNQYEYYLIDEFQDINRVQYETIKLLTKPKNNLFIVGDDDQSIYQFRGARPEFLLYFPKDFIGTESVTLSRNYRSTREIINRSNLLIRHNEIRYDKTIQEQTEKRGEEPKVVAAEDIEDEAHRVCDQIKKEYSRGIPYEEMCVLYRTHIQSRALVDMLYNMNIPFNLRDQVPSIYHHWIAKDILAYFRLSLDETDYESMNRILNKPKRYMKRSIIQEAKKKFSRTFDGIYASRGLQKWQKERIEEFQYHLQILRKKAPYEGIQYIRKRIGYDGYIQEYAAFRKISTKGLYEVLQEIQESAKGYESIMQWLSHIEEILEDMKQKKKKPNQSNQEGVSLSTFHGVKGLEFFMVWIISAVEGVIPHEKSNEVLDIEEERRLFYVGMTRAKEKLTIFTVKTRYEKDTMPSRFIQEMNQSLCREDIQKGTVIKHEKFGVGVIQKVNQSVMEILFDNRRVKKMDIAQCLSGNMMEVASINHK